MSRFALFAVSVCLLVLLAATLPASPAPAATITVNTGYDRGNSQLMPASQQDTDTTVAVRHQETFSNDTLDARMLVVQLGQHDTVASVKQALRETIAPAATSV